MVAVRRVGLVLLVAVGAGGVAWSRRAPAPPAPPPAPPLPGRPRLVQVIGGTMPHGAPPRAPETELALGRLVVGRGRDADLHLADLTVSPRHAAVEVDDLRRVWVRDLGSLNGVSVDGVPVRLAELHDGNRVQLGDAALVFLTDPVQDDGGREGGEFGEDPDVSTIGDEGGQRTSTAAARRGTTSPTTG